MTQETQPPVAPGQIWQENDPRHPRYVRVEQVWAEPESVSIITCDENGVTLPRVRLTEAKLARFNGRRSGYRFIKDGVKAE